MQSQYELGLRGLLYVLLTKWQPTSPTVTGPGQMLASEHFASDDSLEVTHQIQLTLKGE